MGNAQFSLPFKSLFSLPPAHTHSFSNIYYRYRFPNLQHMMQEQNSEQCYILKPSHKREMWESSSPHNKVTRKSRIRAAAHLPGQEHWQQAQPQTGCLGKDVRGKKTKLLLPASPGTISNESLSRDRGQSERPRRTPRWGPLRLAGGFCLSQKGFLRVTKLRGCWGR